VFVGSHSACASRLTQVEPGLFGGNFVGGGQQRFGDDDFSPLLLGNSGKSFISDTP
jgi:hypothetical protein